MKPFRFILFVGILFYGPNEDFDTAKTTSGCSMASAAQYLVVESTQDYQCPSEGPVIIKHGKEDLSTCSQTWYNSDETIAIINPEMNCKSPCEEITPDSIRLSVCHNVSVMFVCDKNFIQEISINFNVMRQAQASSGPKDHGNAPVPFQHTGLVLTAVLICEFLHGI